MSMSRSLKLTKDERQSLEVKRQLEACGELSGELDKLFEEMGQSTTVLRVGMRHHCRIAAGLQRTVEVRLPKPSGEVKSAYAVTLICRLNEERHLVENMQDENLAATLLPAEKFTIGVCDTARQASDDGPYREHRDPSIWHHVTFTTDFSSFFVNLEAPKDCHVILSSKAVAKELSSVSHGHGHGHGHKTAAHKAATSPGVDGEESDESDGGNRISPRPTAVIRKLQQKVKEHKKTKFVERRTRVHVQKSVAPAHSMQKSVVPVHSMRRMDASTKRKGTSFAELVFPEGRPCREPHQVEYAQQKVLQLWLGTHSRFAGKRLQARRPWAKKLSHDFPQKLMHYLWRSRQEQSMLTSIALAGACAFFLKRLRQLHLMRCRTALRQLAWYKALFAASHFMVFAVFMMRGRQQARDKRKGIVSATPARRTSMRRRSSDAEVFFQSTNPLQLVRTYLAKPGRGRAKPTSGDEGEKSDLQRKLRAAKTAPVVDVNSLEHRLAMQGFCLRPRQDMAARGGSKNRQTSRAPKESILHQNHVGAKSIAQRLGRSVQRGPQVIDLGEDVPPDRAQAAQEVAQAAMMTTISPRERAAAVGHKATTVQLIGVEDFGSFYTQAVERAAGELLRQRAKEADQLEEREKVPKVQFVKRYRLRFFDEEVPDFPWLGPLQSLMLVIRGKSVFLTHVELSQYEIKLKNVNEERRAAALRRGWIPPLEAVLWSHPVLVGLSAKMQRALARGEGAFSWKTSLFEGRVEKCSARDLEGHWFLASGGRECRLLRRSVDIGGPFTVSPPLDHEEPQPASAATFAATTTSGGVFWRPFGQTEEQAASSFRLDDPVQRLPLSPAPPQQRLEDACRARRAQTAAEVSEHFGDRTEQMVADAEARSQSRYRSWALASEVPKDARAWKERVLPFFDDFASTCSSLRQAPTFSEDYLEAENIVEASVRLPVVSAQLSDDELEAPPQAPQTADEVGLWLARHDVLQTLKSDDGMNPACSCGWKSGFRREPMTMEEVLRVRILERANASFARRAKAMRTTR